MASRLGLDWNCRVWSAEGMRSWGPKIELEELEKDAAVQAGAASPRWEIRVGTDLCVSALRMHLGYRDKHGEL